MDGGDGEHESSIEERVAALKGQALKDELKRMFGTQTGGEKGVVGQRAKLLEALMAEAAGERVPGTWTEEIMPDPDPEFTPPEGEEEGPKGEAAQLMADEGATPLAFFLMFFTSAMIGESPPPSRLLRSEFCSALKICSALVRWTDACAVLQIWCASRPTATSSTRSGRRRRS